MTPDPEAKRRALQQFLVSGVGAPPVMVSEPDADLTPLAPPMKDEQAGVSTTYQDPDDPIRQELARLRTQADDRARMADLGAVSSRAIEGLTGARGADIWSGMRERADDPLKDFLRLQEMKSKGEKATKPGKPLPSTDPNSPASKRKQMLVKATLGDVYADDEIAQMAEADADEALKYGSMRGTRETTREGHTDANERARLDRQQRSRIWAEKVGLDYDKMSSQEKIAADRLAEAQAAREAAKAKDERTLNERNVGGFTFDPANPPSTDAAKQMAEVSIQSKTITGGLDSLEKLYRSSGTEITGETAGTMAAEWKNLTDMLRNISKMGVPNGKDYEMLAMQLENPTELKSFLTSKARGLAQMATVRKQIQRLVQATADAYKYKPEGAPAAPTPRRVPASQGLPKGPDGQSTLATSPDRHPVRRVPSKDRKWVKIEYSDGTSEVQPNG